MAEFGAGRGQDPFEKIKGLIRVMIEKLENEASEEATGADQVLEMYKEPVACTTGVCVVCVSALGCV